MIAEIKISDVNLIENANQANNQIIKKYINLSLLSFNKTSDLGLW